MHILPKDRCDRLVLPLLAWMPVAFLCLIGTQAAHTGEEAATVLYEVAIVTGILAVPFLIGLYLKIRTSLRSNRT